MVEEKEAGELINLFVTVLVGKIIMDEVMMETFSEMSEEEWDAWDRILSLYGSEVDREKLLEYRKNTLKSQTQR